MAIRGRCPGSGKPVNPPEKHPRGDARRCSRCGKPYFHFEPVKGEAPTAPNHYATFTVRPKSA